MELAARCQSAAGPLRVHASYFFRLSILEQFYHLNLGEACGKLVTSVASAGVRNIFLGLDRGGVGNDLRCLPSLLNSSKSPSRDPILDLNNGSHK